MELVYLWVEDYKNIHKQGFNFSSRFECKYDEDKNELTIDENDDYIENFFGENINVTAIVGKNGSGKSSVLELISFFRFEKISKITNKKVILIFKNKNKLYIMCNKSYHDFSCNSSVVNMTNLEINQKNIHHDDLFNLTMFTNGLYDFTMQSENYYMLRTNHYYNYYNGEHIYFKEKNDDISRYFELNAKYADLIKDNKTFFEFLDEKFIFDSMYLLIDTKRKLELNLYDNDKHLKEYEKINNFYNLQYGIKSEIILGEEKVLIDENIKKLEIIYKFLSFYFLKEYIDLVIRFRHDFKNSFEVKFLTIFIELIITSIEASSNNKLPSYLAIITFTRQYYIKLNKVMLELFKEKEGMRDDYISNSKELKYVRKFSIFAKIIEKNFKLKDYKEDKLHFYLISNEIKIDNRVIEIFHQKGQKNIFLQFLQNNNIIRWEFFKQDTDYNYRKLSTGEKQLLEFLVSFAYTIKKINHEDKIVIFIEEVEISMHPQWQKKLLFLIFKIYKKLNLLNKNDISYHLIFTTHSPFLLSDIPKQNLIFLDTYKKEDKEVKSESKKIGNCKVIDVLSQTFGQNIHTLLSNSFFMNNGLMGDFAKNKIQEIMDFINDKKDIAEISTNEEQIKLVIESIGEPFLKDKLSKMYYDRFDIEKQKKINELEVELERLKND